MGTVCDSCGSTAPFLWVESNGLTVDNFEIVLERGISETLLKENREPVSLCAKCCADRICREIESRDISYLELCSPRDATPGFVLPMAY